MTSPEQINDLNTGHTERPMSPLIQSCEEISEDLRSILRDLRDMKKRREMLETHIF